MVDTNREASEMTRAIGAANSAPDGRQQKDRSRALLESLSAMAAGDADREEVVASLRREGFDALDVLVALFARNTRPTRPAGERIDIQSFVTKPGPSVPATPHKIPNQPFLLRGTLYDPVDISRFDDTELHFVYTGKDHLLAIDDRSIMENWWQTSYLTSQVHAARMPAFGGGEGGGDGFVDPYTSIGVTGYGPTGTDVPYPTGHWVPHGHTKTVPAPAPVEHTNFYEHPANQGDRLELRASQGAMSDLTKEPKGFLGTDDWNDKISSIEMVRTEVTVLSEHVNFGGRSFTTTQSVGALPTFNDLTSSVKTWGSTPWYGTRPEWVVEYHWEPY